jgi:hypothetical protein
VTLFYEDELAAYLQISSVNSDTYVLLSELVEAEIVSETGSLDDLTADQTATARAVALEAVARAYRNPGGLTSRAIDDYRETRDASTVGLYLTSAERARLRRMLDDDSASTGSVVLRPTWRIG